MKKDWMRSQYVERYDALDSYKLSQGCQDCDVEPDLRILQLDHVPERGEKKFNIGAGINSNWRVIVVELTKCDVVCANCHCIRTWKRAQGNPVKERPVE